MMSGSSRLSRVRLVHFNDIYELSNLPRLQTFLSKLDPYPLAVVLSGDFLSPSTLSAIDGGKGMVQTLRSVGLTHASLGNHEADLRLPKLKKRLVELSKTVTILNSNILGTGTGDDMGQYSWLQQAPLQKYDILTSECGKVQIGLMGLMSDEPSMFRDGTFRGATIQNVIQSYDNALQVMDNNKVDFVLPLTHQTIVRDKELAQHMLQVSPDKAALIFGGHEHTRHDGTVTHGDHSIRILKSGYDAQAVDLVDLIFDTSQDKAQLVEMQCDLVEMKDYPLSTIVSRVVDSHMSLLTLLENEEVIHAESFFPPGATLSSVGSRHRQTTVGGILCMAIKEELEVDVAMINGATIKGNKEYKNAVISYSELKKELPFPTKMVIVPMKRFELHDAIYYSRTNPPAKGDEDDEQVERKGYLQVDLEFDSIGFHTGNQNDDLMVALPRNLLKGFCGIQPLIDIGKRLEKEGLLPGEDDYIPAMDLVVTHFSKERWYEIVHDKLTFSQLDREGKGFLTRDDVKRMMKEATGHTPPSFVLDDMMNAIDADENGMIDPGEFSHLLAVMEREHGAHGMILRFD